jgi:hypothetical protein
MSDHFPLTDRLYLLLTEHSGFWLCYDCVLPKLGVTLERARHAAAQLADDGSIRVMEGGTCFLCQKRRTVFATPRTRL